uniref:Large ribosomal subunit protein eL28 n=1 Tax=Bos indicus x Bos taurus TaxID=30522 RepID=A0A4W2F5K0_BOBOX
MSVHLQWMVVRNCYSFLIKTTNRHTARKPNNLKAHNSSCYDGLIHYKRVGVMPGPPLAASGIRTSTARICAWPPSAESGLSSATRSL